ncbi:sugar phosphate isomerase/epimerase family protein [Candidatus Poribacteria bacterium]
MKVGIDSYCYHRYFGEVYDFQKDPGKTWTLEDFLKRAIELKVDGVSLETCFIPSFDEDYLKKIKGILDEANIDRVVAWGHPDGLEAGNNDEALKDMIETIDVAEFMGGSKIMRIVGSSLMFRYEPHGPQLENLTRMLKEATKVAEDKGVIIAMENHIDYTASEILDLIDRVGSKNLGVNFDTGNALRLFEDPVEEAKILADHIYATHIKDVSPKRGGSPQEWNFWESVPAGKGVVDIPGVMKVLKDTGYEGVLAVELDCLREEWEEDQAVEISVDYLKEQGARI